MTEYEKGYKDGMAGAALPNIIDNGDKIDGYAYSYKTDSDGVPYINIDCVRAMLTKAADVQHVKRGTWDFQGYQLFKCTNCKEMFTQNQLEAMQNHKDCEECAFPKFCPNCGADMRNE